MRRAIGLMAGPLRPAVTLEMRGLRVLASIAMPTNVLTSEIASAPAFSADLAMAAMLVTLGESFTITGRRDAALQLATSSSSRARSVPKTMPPWLVLGQETFSSYAAM